MDAFTGKLFAYISGIVRIVMRDRERFLAAIAEYLNGSTKTFRYKLPLTEVHKASNFFQKKKPKVLQSIATAVRNFFQSRRILRVFANDQKYSRVLHLLKVCEFRGANAPSLDT